MMFFLLISTIIVILFIKFVYEKLSGKDNTLLSKGYEEQWFGKGPGSSEGVSDAKADIAIHPFQIQILDSTLTDLKQRIEKTRFEESLEETDFEYGFHSKYLREVVEYWKKDFDWRKQEEYINQYPHFKTKIEGIDVHFVHVKPSIPEGKKSKIIPILLVHGWPGSFVEFYKLIPMLTAERPNQDFVFEVICPSIPGYGFSESPHHKGFNQRAAARIFVTLMGRLGHSKFYLQGGDWGSFIVTLIAKFYPAKVAGVHVNMFSVPYGFVSVLLYIFLHFFHFLLTPEEYKAGFPFFKKFKGILQETGYFHIQTTKPDTVGVGLADSPVGLAAYILEKFSTWTDLKHRGLPDGGLTKKFTMDELLTNVTIYWVNQNITASTRFYKEFMRDKNRSLYDNKPIPVPCGIALFPNEILMHPKLMITKKYVKKLVSYTVMPRGGHFAAMEEPKLMADDVWNFVKLTEEGFDELLNN